MTPSPNPEFQSLLNKAIDAELSDAEEEVLRTILRNDAVARRYYLQFMQLHAELQWNHGATASMLFTQYSQESITPRATLPAHLGNWAMWAVAVAAVAAGVLLFLETFQGASDSNLTSRWSPTIATVENAQGIVSFRNSDQVSHLTPNGQMQLPSGTLLVEGESSSVQFRFRDGTLITVSGNAEVSVNDDGQKMLRLRLGTLTAEVRPQPVDVPLIVQTPTARVEVLGTVFTLAAESEQTRLSVDEGLVRLRRLVDGQTVDVPGEHSCVASLDARDNLRTDGHTDLLVGWEHRFDKAPPAEWKGKWLPPNGDLPGRVRAVPCIMGRKQWVDEAPIIHYGITTRRVAEISLGSLPDNATLRLVYQTRQPSQLQIMLGLTRSDGRFGGNFEVKISSNAGESRSDGWQELVVPLSAFQPLIARYPKMALHARPYLIVITTLTQDSSLEISELGIYADEKFRRE